MAPRMFHAMGHDRALANLWANRFQRDRDIAMAICRSFGAQTLFFIQPNALYNYPPQLYRPKPPDSWRQKKSRVELFYPMLRQQPNTTYLGDLFASYGAERKAVLDDVHYSPDFNHYLAERVASYLELGKLMPSPPIDDAAATGVKRQTGSN